MVEAVSPHPPTVLQETLHIHHIQDQGAEEVVRQKEVQVRVVPLLLAGEEVFLVAVVVENCWDNQTTHYPAS